MLVSPIAAAWDPLTALKVEMTVRLTEPSTGSQSLIEGDSSGVTSSDNYYANLDAMAALYGRQANDGTDQELAASRFWYHAEAFDLVRLQWLAGMTLKRNLTEAFTGLSGSSVLLCYYLFFPGTDGGLEGCNDLGAKRFDHAAGQWTCISILLEGTTAPGQPTAYTPTSIATTCPFARRSHVRTNRRAAFRNAGARVVNCAENQSRPRGR